MQLIRYWYFSKSSEEILVKYQLHRPNIGANMYTGPHMKFISTMMSPKWKRICVDITGPVQHLYPILFIFQYNKVWLKAPLRVNLVAPPVKLAYNAGDGKAWSSILEWRSLEKKWQLTLSLLAGESHGQKAWWAQVRISKSQVEAEWLAPSTVLTRSRYAEHFSPHVR